MSGQVRSDGLTCTFRTSCCSARLSRAQYSTFLINIFVTTFCNNTNKIKFVLNLRISGGKLNPHDSLSPPPSPEGMAQLLGFYLFLLCCILYKCRWYAVDLTVVMSKNHFHIHHTKSPPLSYFLFQPVLHDWCNKGCGMYYPVCGMVHIKEPLLLKSSLCGGSGFLFSLSEWSLSICLTPYNCR